MSLIKTPNPFQGCTEANSVSLQRSIKYHMLWYPGIPDKNKTICDSYCIWISPWGNTLHELSKLHRLSYISSWFIWLHVSQFVFWLNIHTHRPHLERCLLYILNFLTANTWQIWSALDIISTHTHKNSTEEHIHWCMRPRVHAGGESVPGLWSLSCLTVSPLSKSNCSEDPDKQVGGVSQWLPLYI